MVTLYIFLLIVILFFVSKIVECLIFISETTKEERKLIKTILKLPESGWEQSFEYLGGYYGFYRNGKYKVQFTASHLYIYFEYTLLCDFDCSREEWYKDFRDSIEGKYRNSRIINNHKPQRTPTTKEVFEDLQEIEKKKKEIEDIRGKYQDDFNKTFKK